MVLHQVYTSTPRLGSCALKRNLTNNTPFVWLTLLEPGWRLGAEGIFSLLETLIVQSNKVHQKYTVWYFYITPHTIF